LLGALAEKIENLRQQVGFYAVALVAHAQHGVAAFGRHPQPDHAIRR
jgi:hypothetical protein